MLVNCCALAYGIFAMILLAKPVDTDNFIDKWAVLIGTAIVLGSGLLYMTIAKPYNGSEGIPEGDAVEMADRLREIRSHAR